MIKLKQTIHSLMVTKQDYISHLMYIVLVPLIVALKRAYKVVRLE